MTIKRNSKNRPNLFEDSAEKPLDDDLFDDLEFDLEDYLDDELLDGLTKHIEEDKNVLINSEHNKHINCDESSNITLEDELLDIELLDDEWLDDELEIDGYMYWRVKNLSKEWGGILGLVAAAMLVYACLKVTGALLSFASSKLIVDVYIDFVIAGLAIIIAIICLLVTIHSRVDFFARITFYGGLLIFLVLVASSDNIIPEKLVFYPTLFGIGLSLVDDFIKGRTN